MSLPIHAGAVPGPEGRSLIETAESVLALAREEAEVGYASGDERRVRDAAEKAWLASTLATDWAMQRHGRVPEPGRGAHADRHDFLETIGRRDLSKELAYFADRLHGDCFYGGLCPSSANMGIDLEEVAQYIHELRARA